MAVSIDDLRGMTPELAAKLKARGLGQSDQLLDAARIPSQRKELAAAVGAEPRVILELANRADLARVKGVGAVYSDLLELAGVDTVKELATRRADNLYAKMKDTNAEGAHASQLPTQTDVESWVEQAKALPKTLEY